VESLLGALEASEAARWLRSSRWGYAAANAAHIFGVALLVGAILPLNLRLLGAWPSVPRATLARVLVPVAAIGLALAATAGALLFAVRAREYAAMEVLQLKLALVAIGAVAAVALHRTSGRWLEAAGRGRLAAHAALSAVCWIGALVCGRLIAFVGE